VYERLSQMIVAGELAPGSSLWEADLAARLGVSRTPVRAALHRLEEYGLVAMRPNHGAVVRRLGREEVVAIHQLREAMEGLACGRLAPEDFARLDGLAEAAREPHAPNHFEAFDQFDAELHSTVAGERTRSFVTGPESCGSMQGLLTPGVESRSKFLQGHRLWPGINRRSSGDKSPILRG
jgi:DNA-binding GntR family transcriptional regulator